MPEWQHRRIRMTLEFNVDGSMSGGTAIDTAVDEIRKIKEVAVSDIDGEVHMYVKPPEITTITIERR